MIALEFASGDGSEERDRTPLRAGENRRPGQFSVYEQIVKIFYYGIYMIKSRQLDLDHLVDGEYQRLVANNRGHYEIPSLGVELGLWYGSYQNQNLTWLRWWDSQGNLLLTGQEPAELEKVRAETAETALTLEREKARRLAQRLRELGIDPETL